MKRIFTIAALVMGMFAAQETNAQKIAVISPDEIMANMKEIKKADTFLAQYSATLENDLATMEEELGAKYEKFVKDSAKMTPGVKEAQKTTLQKEIQDFQTKQQEMKQQLEAEKEKQYKPIREKMLKTIEDVAKELGYTFVMYKEQLIVSPPENDITAKVKAKLGVK